MIRQIFSVAVGLVVAMVVIVLIQAAGQFLHPPPAGIDPSDREALRALIEGMPVTALLIVLASYVAGSLIGGATATLVVRRASLVPAVAVGLILMLFGGLNFLQIPHPAWFVAASLLAFLPLSWLAGRWVRAQDTVPSMT